MAIRQKLKLGDVLVQAGAITAEQLSQALAQQKQKNIPLGQALVELDFITEEKFLTSLANQLKIPYLDMQGVKISQDAIRKVQESVARKHKIIPISIENGSLKLAMTDPLNIFAVDEVTIQSGMDVVTVLAAESDIERAIQEQYGVAASIKAAVNSLGVQEEKKEEAAALVSGGDTPATLNATEAPVAKLVEMILKQALKECDPTWSTITLQK
jgi:type IV pilus assembly protein PilB